MKNIGLKISLILLLINASLLTKAQHYVFEEITKKDGLASNNVNCIFKDSKGYMWFGTGDGGVSRYDGKKFHNYSKTEGLPHNDVRCVMEDKKGNIWLATHGGGISCFNGRTFTNYNHDQGLQNDFVYKIVQDHQGIFWLSTWGGSVIRFDGKKFRSYKHDSLISPMQVSSFVDSKGRVWCGGGLSVFENDTFYTFTSKDGFRNKGEVWDIKEDSKGNIWFTEYDYGIGRYDGKKIEYFLVDSTKRQYFIPLQITKDGFWIGSDQNQGIMKWDGKNTKVFGPKNGLKNATIWSMLYDDEGILWIGSLTGGVYKLKNEHLLKYSSADGLPEDDIQALAIDSNNVTWMGFANSGVHGLKKDSVIKLKKENNDATKNTTALCINKKNNLFIGTWRNGFFLKENEQLKQIKKYDPANGSAPVEAYCDQEGKIWIGNWLSCGGEYYDGNKFHEMLPPDIDIISIRTDKNGTAYVSTHGVVFKWKEGNKPRAIDKREKLSDLDPGSLYIDKYGYLWICHQKGGGISLFHTEKKTWKYITTKNGLCDNAVKNICEDNDGNIWVATGNGICKLLRPKQDSFVPLILDKDVALAGKSCNGINYNKKTNTISVTVSNEGLFVIPIDKLENHYKAPRLVLQGIDVNYERVYNGYLDSIVHEGIKISESEKNIQLELEYYKNNLSFEIAGINLSDPNSIKYSWILENFDNKPTPFRDIDHINYTNLPAGKYVLKITAVNGLLKKTEKPLEISIVIIPPFWRTTWFYTLSAFIIILFLVLYIRFREKKLKETQHLLEKTVNERTAEVVQQKHLVEEKQKEIIDSINYAKRIQQALLAHEEFLNKNITDNFVLFKPKDIVSGDFYWATLHNNKFYLAVCDSTGHGVPGAFMSLVNIGYLSEAINEKNIEQPHEVLEHVRRRLIENISRENQKDGFDGILLCIDKTTNIITYSAAHNSPVIIHNGQLEELAADKMPVGIGERKENFKLHTIKSEIGNMLYLYTDGYADQFGGPKGKKFKYRSLNELLVSIHHKNLNEQKEILNLEFEKWRGDLEQVDDVCVIGIRI